MNKLKMHYVVLNKKLCTYAQVKADFKFDTVTIIHNLEVETGRFGKNPIPRIERHCSFCLAIGSRVLGDEFHLLMVCPEFADKRCYLLNELQRTAPILKQLTSWNQFIWILSQEDLKCLHLVATFLYKCFETRLKE